MNDEKKMSLIETRIYTGFNLCTDIRASIVIIRECNDRLTGEVTDKVDKIQPDEKSSEPITILEKLDLLNKNLTDILSKLSKQADRLNESV